MTRKQIDAARETRLWIKEVIVPAVAVGITLLSIPETRETICSGVNKSKTWVKSKLNFKKEKKES